MTIANGWLWVVFDNLHALGEQQEEALPVSRHSTGPCLSVLPAAHNRMETAVRSLPPLPQLLLILRNAVGRALGACLRTRMQVNLRAEPPC